MRYASAKASEVNRWTEAKVSRKHQQFLEVREIKNDLKGKGPPMEPAYEALRLALHTYLIQKLMICSPEYELGFLVDGEGTLVSQ